MVDGASRDPSTARPDTQETREEKSSGRFAQDDNGPSQQEGNRVRWVVALREFDEPLGLLVQ